MLPIPFPGFPMSRESYRNWVWFAPFLSYIGEFETKLGLHYGLVFRDPTRDCRMIHFCYHLALSLLCLSGHAPLSHPQRHEGSSPGCHSGQLDALRGTERGLVYQNPPGTGPPYVPPWKRCFFPEKEIPFLSRKALSDFWAHCKEELVPEDEEPFLYLCFFYILALHL